MGADLRTSTGANTIAQNTLSANGTGSGAAPTETAGLALGGAALDGRSLRLSDNYGAGVMVASGGATNGITRNSIYGNGTIVSAGGAAASGQIGIDLLAAADDAGRGTSPYVTLNDNGDGDAGGNALLNFPVLEQRGDHGRATSRSPAGRAPARPSNCSSPTPTRRASARAAPTRRRSSRARAADLDATTSSYSGTINGVDQGTDNTNRFRFTFALPPGVVVGRAAHRDRDARGHGHVGVLGARHASAAA